MPERKAMDMNNAEMPIIRLFWTGGFDSSFRVVQLSRCKVIIQPYYVVDNKYRRSIENELKAIGEITEDIIANPHTKCVIHPLVKVYVEDIEPDKEIEEAFTRVKREIALGTQYEWLARFARVNPGIELCLEKDETSHVYNYFQKNGVENTITEGEIIFQELDKSRSSEDLVTIFGNFHFPLPLREMTKLEMVELYRSMGYYETMLKTWFCHNPVKNRPCGVCNPCKIVIKEGLSFRMPPSSMKRYATEMKNKGKLWFRLWKKLRWRIKRY